VCLEPTGALHFKDLRSKPVLTAVGMLEVSRPYYLCPRRHTGQFPADVALDIENTELSPGMRRMQAMVGQAAPSEGRSPRASRPGKIEGQPSHKREVKLGCVFTQTAFDDEAILSATPIRPRMPAISRPPKSSAAGLVQTGKDDLQSH
jgi:hypothetical protein